MAAIELYNRFIWADFLINDTTSISHPFGIQKVNKLEECGLTNHC
jgi:hypothetical protein